MLQDQRTGAYRSKSRKLKLTQTIQANHNLQSLLFFSAQNKIARYSITHPGNDNFYELQLQRMSLLFHVPILYGSFPPLDQFAPEVKMAPSSWHSGSRWKLDYSGRPFITDKHGVVRAKLKTLHFVLLLLDCTLTFYTAQNPLGARMR